jgi:uncharacterized protein Yka (UPF0111/DUF47 family)
MSEPSRKDERPPPEAPRPRRGWLRRLLPRKAPDVLALLAAQGQISVTGLNAFEQWSQSGDAGAAELVRAARKDGYTARRELLAALQAALSTPVDQEDLYVLSERVDHVLNAARHAVREAEVLGWKPDTHAAQMAARLAHGTRELLAGFELLREDGRHAGVKADAASDAVRHVERDYRGAMAELLEEDDLRAVLAGQDLYRRYLVVAEEIIGVADRLWYVVLQEA